MAEPALAALQAWMQGRVTGGLWGLDEPGEEGWRAADVVVSTGGVTAAERVEIYARDYVLRLAECLKAEFPVLRALIGEQVFGLFVGGYLSARPPGSYSLYDLGAGFPAYLEATRPRPHTGPGTLDALPASLARLERAISESGRAQGVETAGAAPFDPAPVLADPEVRVRTPESLGLLRLDFDFTPALAAARAGRTPDPPAPLQTLMAVARSRYRVRAYVLEPWAFAWLETLRDEHGDVAAANRAAKDAGGPAASAVPARLLAWLPKAAEAGFVMPSAPSPS